MRKGRINWRVHFSRIKIIPVMIMCNNKCCFHTNTDSVTYLLVTWFV